MSLLRALWNAACAHYYRAALDHMRIDHPDLPFVSLKYALHREQVDRFLREGQ